MERSSLFKVNDSFASSDFMKGAIRNLRSWERAFVLMFSVTKIKDGRSTNSLFLWVLTVLCSCLIAISVLDS